MGQIGAQAEPDHDGLARAAIEAYRYNRESFPYFKCRYTVTTGTARNLKESLAGAKLTNMITTHVLWVVDGKKVMHREVADPKIFQEADKKARTGKEPSGKVALPAASEGYLSDGTHYLAFAPELQGANVSPAGHPLLGIGETPLSMGIMGADEFLNPGRLLQDCHAGRRVLKGHGLEEIDGTAAVTLSFTSTIDKMVYRYSFDVNRGYLPLRFTCFTASGQSLVQAYLTHARQCTKDRWFPERTVQVSSVVQPGLPVGVREMKVVELEVDKRPGPEEFRLELPARTLISDPTDQTKYFYLRQNERVGPEHLPKISAMLAKVKTTPRMNTAIPQPSRYGWLGWVGGPALGVLAAVASLLAWRRWRHW